MLQFSVLISVYKGDNPKFFSEALESIYSQTLQASEIVLVEDGSLTNELYAVIEKYRLSKLNLKVVKLETNSGLGEALRVGLNYCCYEIVARMDSDDIAFHDRFEKQVSYLLTHPNTDVLGAHILEFEFKPGDLNKQKRVPITHQEVVRYATLRNPINHPTVIFRKKAVLSVGSYKSMPLFEDYYLWLRMLKAGCIIENLDTTVLYFRVANMHKRRHGLSYFKKEIHFFRTLKNENLISVKQYMLMLGTRLPFRILPKRVLSVIYNQFLREGGFISRLLRK